MEMVSTTVIDGAIAAGYETVAWMLMSDDNHSGTMAEAGSTRLVRRYQLFERAV